MDKHSRDVYQHAINYLEKKQVDNNILEFVCRYHRCEHHTMNMNKRELFVELRQYFSLTTVRVILQLISAMSKGEAGETYPAYTQYLDALKYGEKQSKSGMEVVE